MPIILLSPAKAMDESVYECENKEILAEITDTDKLTMKTQTAELLAVMKEKTCGELKKLMGISDSLAVTNIYRQCSTPYALVKKLLDQKYAL